MSEVLARAPARQRDFLIRTAIVEQMCAGVCNAVCGYDPQDASSNAGLDWLEQNNLFVISLDMERHWYRYHHLLRSFLLGELARHYHADEIAQLHSRASAWFAAHGMVEEALRHALQGSDPQQAIGLIAEHRHALMDAEEWQLHGRLLQLFPPSLIAGDPDLTLMTVWMSRLGWRDPAHLVELLDRADTLIAQLEHQPDHARRLSGEVAALRALLVYETATDPQQVLVFARHALAATSRAWYYVRSIAWLYLAVGYQMAGDLDAAYATIDEGHIEDVTQDGEVHRRVAASRCFVDWMAGNLQAVPLEATRLCAVGLTHRRPESLAWGHSLLCSAAYQRNDLDAAEMHAKAVEELRYLSRPMAYLQSAFAYVSLLQARCLPEQANQKLDQVFGFLQETQHEGLLPLVYAFQAELAVRQGNLAAANRWAASQWTYLPLAAMPYCYAPQTALPTVLLALNTPDSQQQITEEIDRLLAFAESIHNTYVTIKALALKALAEYARGHERSALTALERAVTLAAPGGILRLFVDLGPPMEKLFSRLAAVSGSPDHVATIWQAFTLERAPHARPPAVRTAQTGLVEPLTRRETEVLSLLAQRLSAKEISEKLVVSDQTVKRHRANIYQKLGVNSRQEAVTAAIAAGLLPAPE